MSNTRTAALVSLPQRGRAVIRQPVFQLTVRGGPSQGKVFRVSTPHFILGSGDGADVRLEDPTVSAAHCELRCDTLGLRARDLGSKNGVYLSGHRVEEVWLADEAELQLGDSLILVEALDQFEDRALPPLHAFGRLVGSAPVMRDVFRTLEHVSQSKAPVLLLGETGTGKELAADGIVEAGPLRQKPFVVVNCAAVVATLAESELFGHERGAFTGASRRHRGAFEQAHGGTLFLDEVGELPLDLQARVLGAIERKQIQRVGGTEPVDVDVRVISATHRDLPVMMNKGTFRADLFYRLAALVVRLPPLRAHPEDIPALIGHLLQEMGSTAPLPASVLQRLYDTDYPGNVRELRNAVARAAAGLPAESSSPAELFAAGSKTEADLEQPYRLQKERLISAYERNYLERLLAVCKGSVAEVSRRSGINRIHVYEMLKRHGLFRSD